jgi:DNA-binding CsgD family transcriptional regulator
MASSNDKTNTPVTREQQRALTLSKAIDTIGQPEFLPNMMDYLRIDVPFVGMLLLLIDEKNRPYHIYDTIRAAYRPNLNIYLDGVYQLDPFFVSFRKNRRDCAMLIRDVAPDRFQITEYYRRYYQNIELRDEMALYTGLDDGQFLSFSIGRRSFERKFRRQELKSIERDLPVLGALCRQHFNLASHNEYKPSKASAEQRLEFALERFGEEALTPRERDVAVCILKGHSSKSTAKEIEVSPETVKIHRKNIYRKLKVTSQSDLFVHFVATLN